MAVRAFVERIGAHGAALALALAAVACSAGDERVALPGLDGAPSESPSLPAPPTVAPTSVADDDAGDEAVAEPESTAGGTGSIDDGAADDEVDEANAADADPDGTATTVAVAEPIESTDDEGEAEQPEPEPDDPFLRVGDSGPSVASMQRRLIVLEYLPAGADTGQFDQATADALIDFQAQYGLVVDGIFGPQTDRALNAAAASVDTAG